jgi:hypothetical protein
VVPSLDGGGVLLTGGHDASGTILDTAEIWDPATHKTVVVNPMSTARELHTATLLNDGTILVAGGTTSNPISSLEQAELFDPKSGGFMPTGSLKHGRFDHNAVLFHTGPLAGKVLIVGGCCDHTGSALKTAELYDPETKKFTLTGSMATARMDATATVLDNGYVLIAGGAAFPTDYYGTAKAELFDPATQTFSPTGDMQQARRSQSAALLENGQVLVSGGYSHPIDPLKSAEIYNPGDGRFVLTGSMPLGRRYQSSTLMPTGQVLVDGGWNSPGTGLTFDVNAASFTDTSNAMSEFRDRPTATLVSNTETTDDGKVLLAGGASLPESTKGGKSLDLFNPVSNSFEPAGTMSTARHGLTATAFGTNQESQ